MVLSLKTMNSIQKHLNTMIFDEQQQLVIACQNMIRQQTILLVVLIHGKADYCEKDVETLNIFGLQLLRRRETKWKQITWIPLISDQVKANTDGAS